MLYTIEEMKYYLRTVYGDFKNYRGQKISVKFQGLCQGNGAAPAGWAVISITILNAHKKKGHGAKFVCPISQWYFKHTVFQKKRCSQCYLQSKR